MEIRKIFLVTIIVFLFGIVEAGHIIVVESNMYRMDKTLKLILINQDLEYLNKLYSNEKKSILLDDEEYVLKEPIITIQIGHVYYVVNSAGEEYSLYFTELPIIEIKTSNEIDNITKKLAYFTMVEKNQNMIHSAIGVKYRGGSTFQMPKKPFRIEFWEDDTGDITKDVELLKMRSDDDWNLQAIYNEPLRFRSKTNNDLWRKIYSPYYQSMEPDAINGIKMKYAELFFNGEYRGLYCVSERVDRKQLKLKKYNGDIRGELYKGIAKGNSIYEKLPPYENGNSIWDGFEYIYPDEIAPYWNNLYDFVDFVINSENSVFYSQYNAYFDIDNLVDYYIFLNLLRATDNTGKNVFVAKYKIDEPYFYVPWDLDGTFGIRWTGKKEYITNDLLSNGLYDRLWNDCYEGGFKEKLKNRWNGLRKETLTYDNLMEMFLDNYNYLLDNGVYERESIVWTEYKLDYDDIIYMSDWLSNRLKFLDRIFNAACDESVIRSYDNSNFNIYPNPVRDELVLEADYESDFTIDIYNYSGQLLLSSMINSQNNKIRVSDLSNGIYFIHIRNEGISVVKKIIVQR